MADYWNKVRDWWKVRAVCMCVLAEVQRNLLVTLSLRCTERGCCRRRPFARTLLK